jgi:hypothetical protein
MQDPADAVDAYLASRFGSSLERVLVDATGKGIPPAMSGSVAVACDPVGFYGYEDGGASEMYQGILTVEGVAYRFRCSIFADSGGARFVESIGELDALRWTVGLAIPASPAPIPH